MLTSRLSLPALVLLPQFALAQSPTTSPPSPTTARHALIIGVDDYTDPDIIDLRYAARDAREVARTLIESGAYPTEHVVVMTADHPNPALRPTRTHILEQLRGLQQQADAGSRRMKLLLQPTEYHHGPDAGAAFLQPRAGRFS